MCDRRTPHADTVIGSLKTPRPNLGPGRTVPPMVAVRPEPELEFELEPELELQAALEPADATRVEYHPIARLSAEEAAAVQAEIDAAVREVVEGRLDVKVQRRALARTGTEGWMPPGHGAERPGAERRELTVVANVAASDGPPVQVSVAAVAHASGSPAPVRDASTPFFTPPSSVPPSVAPTSEMTPAGTVVAMNPLLLVPQASETVVAMNPLLMAEPRPAANAAPSSTAAMAAASPVPSPIEGARVTLPQPLPSAPTPEKVSMFSGPDLVPVSTPEPIDRTVVASGPPTHNPYFMAAPLFVAPAAPVAPIAAPNPGVHAVVLGSYLGDSQVPSCSIEINDHESLEVGSKPGSTFANDPYVSRYHAALVPTPEGVLLEDFGATNGVFMRVRGCLALRSTETIRVGRQILEFATLQPESATQQSVKHLGSPDPGYWARVAVMLDLQRTAAAIALQESTATVGRDNASTLAFADDERLEANHCTFSNGPDGPTLQDADAPNGTTNGTWIRLRGGDTIPYGAELLIGDTRVRLDRRA